MTLHVARSEKRCMLHTKCPLHCMDLRYAKSAVFFSVGTCRKEDGCAVKCSMCVCVWCAREE